MPMGSAAKRRPHWLPTDALAHRSREPVLGATVFSLPQTVPDCPGALVQVGGSPFDCAGLGSTDWMRMACKRPGVRVPLAPQFFVPVLDEKVTIVSHGDRPATSLTSTFHGCPLACGACEYPNPLEGCSRPVRPGCGNSARSHLIRRTDRPPATRRQAAVLIPTTDRRHIADYSLLPGR